MVYKDQEPQGTVLNVGFRPAPPRRPTSPPDPGQMPSWKARHGTSESRFLGFLGGGGGAFEFGVLGFTGLREFRVWVQGLRSLGLKAYRV